MPPHKINEQIPMELSFIVQRAMRKNPELRYTSAKEMRESIDDTAQKLKPYCLRLDFTGVPFMDSSGIGLILGRVRLCGFWRGHVVLCGLSQNLTKMVDLAGISGVAAIERRAG